MPISNPSPTAKPCVATIKIIRFPPHYSYYRICACFPFLHTQASNSQQQGKQQTIVSSTMFSSLLFFMGNCGLLRVLFITLIFFLVSPYPFYTLFTVLLLRFSLQCFSARIQIICMRTRFIPCFLAASPFLCFLALCLFCSLVSPCCKCFVFSSLRLREGCCLLLHPAR